MLPDLRAGQVGRTAARASGAFWLIIGASFVAAIIIVVTAAMSN